MIESEPKPLKWTPDPQVGFDVVRRMDGSLHFTFTDLSHETLVRWRELAMEHLLGSDRLTRNLYDLRQIETIPEEAIQYAIEVNNDPSTRNIRVAVVAANERVKEAIEEVKALTTPGGVELQVFTDLEQAERWLSRPLDLLV